MIKINLVSLRSLRRSLALLLLLSPGTLATAEDSVGQWAQWRGPNRDGISTEKGLLKSWPDQGPNLDYRVKGLGGGMSSVAIADGKILTMGSKDGSTQLICLGQQDGQILWSTAFTPNKQDPTCSPTIDVASNLVYALSNDGVLVCCKLDDGTEVWKTSFTADFGGKIESSWGYSESPLVDGDLLICTPGAQGAMVVALEKTTGKVVWKGRAPEGNLLGNDGAGYSSVVISKAAGIKQYVQLIGHGIVSYEAETGELLWNYDRIANRTANIPTPITKDNYVFCSTGYDDGGTALLEINKKGKKLSVKEVYYKTNKELQNHHGGMIMIGNYVYMGHGHNNGFPACVEWKTGKNLWGKSRGAGTGSAAVVAADGKLYFRYQDSTMALISTKKDKYELISQFKLPSHNGESWPHPVIAGGKLIIRDQDELFCFDLTSSDKE
jgi:outer membrane protein assembly factor BamB